MSVNLSLERYVISSYFSCCGRRFSGSPLSQRIRQTGLWFAGQHFSHTWEGELQSLGTQQDGRTSASRIHVVLLSVFVYQPLALVLF